MLTAVTALRLPALRLPAPRVLALRSTLVLLLVLALVGSIVPFRPAQAADNATVRINGGFPTRAGYTGKGGIFASSYSILPCGTEENDKVDVREFTVTISRDGKTVRTTHRQFDLVRVAPGSYRVHAKLRYTYRGKTTTKTKTQTMKVTRKTDATSISSTEYKRIKKGMTLAQVRTIIGGKGQYQDGSLSMDALKFEWTTGVTFAKGRVTDKWTFENSYDWC